MCVCTHSLIYIHYSNNAHKDKLREGRMNFVEFMINLRKDIEGASMIEYAILASLVSVVAIGAITTVGTNVNTTFDTVGAKIAGGSR